MYRINQRVYLKNSGWARVSHLGENQGEDTEYGFILELSGQVIHLKAKECRKIVFTRQSQAQRLNVRFPYDIRQNVTSSSGDATKDFFTEVDNHLFTKKKAHELGLDEVSVRSWIKMSLALSKNRALH